MTIENLTDPKRQSKTGSDLRRRMRLDIRAEAATEAFFIALRCEKFSMLWQLQNLSEELAPHTNDPQRSVGFSFLWCISYKRQNIAKIKCSNCYH